MTCEELIKKLQQLPLDTEIAIEDQYGLSSLLEIRPHETEVRKLSIDYGGDFHPPASLENYEYSLSIPVKNLAILCAETS
jgi:hypothetical protein